MTWFCIITAAALILGIAIGQRTSRGYRPGSSGYRPRTGGRRPAPSGKPPGLPPKGPGGIAPRRIIVEHRFRR